MILAVTKLKLSFLFPRDIILNVNIGIIKITFAFRFIHFSKSIIEINVYITKEIFENC